MLEILFGDRSDPERGFEILAVVSLVANTECLSQPVVVSCRVTPRLTPSPPYVTRFADLSEFPTRPHPTVRTALDTETLWIF